MLRMLRHKHKGFRWTAILIVLLLLAAACGGDDEQDADPVVIGLEQELTNFNNLTAGDNLLAGRQVIRSVWPTCTRTLPDSTFEPYFCESLPTIVNEDPLVVEYKLRADATWSDGTPVSSDDMVFYFENCNDPEVPGTRAEPAGRSGDRDHHRQPAWRRDLRPGVRFRERPARPSG